jgi:hypothetical protein
VLAQVANDAAAEKSGSAENRDNADAHGRTGAAAMSLPAG